MPEKKVFVATEAEFRPGARNLIQVEGRNIAVVNYRGSYYALDNACYHHGGALVSGDIEMLGSHPCIRCPLHSYQISLTTGEGFYWGIQPSDGKQVLKSKGPKQRFYNVIAEGGNVYCLYTTSGTFESDSYAKMAVANKEKPGQFKGRTGATGLHSTAGGTGGLSSSSGSGNGGGFGSSGGGALDSGRSGAFLRRNQQVQNFSSGGRGTSNGDDDVVVRCLVAHAVCASGHTKVFAFEKVGGTFVKRLEAGQHATLIIPLGGDEKGGTTNERTWTITTLRGEYGGWFTTTVRRAVETRGGSTWLHDHALRVPLPLKQTGGHFTLTAARERINSKRGYVLMISAGIGVTPMYSSCYKHLNDQFTMMSGPPLHILHLHSERYLDDVPYLGTFAAWNEQFGVHSKEESPMTYQFKLAVTTRMPSTQPDWTSPSSPFLCSFPPSSIAAPSGSAPGAVDPDKVTKSLEKLRSWGNGGSESNRLKKNSCAVTPSNILPLSFGQRIGKPQLQAAVEYFGDAKGDFMCMVCGPQSFMDAVGDTLCELGVVRNNIMTEAFDF